MGKLTWKGKIVGLTIGKLTWKGKGVGLTMGKLTWRGKGVGLTMGKLTWKGKGVAQKNLKCKRKKFRKIYNKGKILPPPACLIRLKLIKKKLVHHIPVQGGGKI